MTHGVGSEKTCSRLCAYTTASFKDIDSINVISVDDGRPENPSKNLS